MLESANDFLLQITKRTGLLVTRQLLILRFFEMERQVKEDATLANITQQTLVSSLGTLGEAFPLCCHTHGRDKETCSS